MDITLPPYNILPPIRAIRVQVRLAVASFFFQPVRVPVASIFMYNQFVFAPTPSTRRRTKKPEFAPKFPTVGGAIFPVFRTCIFLATTLKVLALSATASAFLVAPAPLRGVAAPVGRVVQRRLHSYVRLSQWNDCICVCMRVSACVCIHVIYSCPSCLHMCPSALILPLLLVVPRVMML